MTITVALITAALTTPAAAQRCGAIDAYVGRAMAAQGIPGATVRVDHGGRVVHRGAYGVANVEWGIPARVGTVYDLASITKSFTAVAALQLVAHRTLALDDSIGRYLPELPPSWKGVRVRELLAHTAGLPDMIDPRTDGLVASSYDSALAMVRVRPLQFAPGTSWTYDQTTYVLLQRIIEKVAATPLDAYLRAHVFAPLGMSRTSFGDSYAVVTGRAEQYERAAPSELRVRMSRVPTFAHGAGGLNSTVDDLAAWVEAVRDGKVIPADLRDLMWAPAELRNGTHVSIDGPVGYGFGVITFSIPGNRSVGHLGASHSAYRYFRDANSIVVVLTNGKGDTDGIVDSVEALSESAACRRRLVE
ncbi:MAG TPA: serine hydrolase domain-containing protein [Gemmatimonadaceae bacterium]